MHLNQHSSEGCTSFRKENLTSHAASSAHKKCQGIEDVKMTTPGSHRFCLADVSSMLRKVWMLIVGNTYHTDKKCKEFLDSTTEIERQDLKNNLRSVPYLSVMCDEFVDSAA
ncbi:hypothetical protein PR048_012233 [Dryococelus australis]|uniref:Uncharacterized protein n=1 Tax=Dryococelus australis TaxID=614101 RepID=A0ABQ9HP62_9NEOP|nr:hypothetical protein PR048_012233 [Dryococelus australis]